MQKLLVCAAILLLASSAGATTLVSVSGIFGNANDVFSQTFLYDPSMGAALDIQTWGYGGTSHAPGGTNLAGLAIAGGGFDPRIQLWAGVGGAATLVAQNDDGANCFPSGPAATSSGHCWDSHLRLNGLAGGFYTITLTAFPNRELGPTLTADFTNNGDFSGRRQNYALDVQAVPEPLSLLLIGSGLLGLGPLLRRSRKA